MQRQSLLRIALVLAFVTIPASVALGNSIAPILYVPGLVIISPLLGLPATLAAAVIERPFVTLAGVRRYALTRSIRANLLSWLVGLLMSIVAVATPLAFAGLGIPYIVLAVCVSIVVEGAYYTEVLGEGPVLRWRWVVLANVLSAGVLMGLSIVPGALRNAHPRLEWTMRPYVPIITWILAAICIVLVAFALRPLGEPRPSGPEQSPPSSEAKVGQEEAPAP